MGRTKAHGHYSDGVGRVLVCHSCKGLLGKRGMVPIYDKPLLMILNNIYLRLKKPLSSDHWSSGVTPEKHVHIKYDKNILELITTYHL